MSTSPIKVIVQNKKAFHEYTISERTEAGIALRGTEVKSIRDGKVNLNDGWVEIDGTIATLRDVHIGQYSFGNIMNHAEKRPRQLLLSRKELVKLGRALEAKGLTIVPLKMYLKGRLVKVEIGIAKGKKLHDKRDSAKSKDAEKQMARALKARR